MPDNKFNMGIWGGRGLYDGNLYLRNSHKRAMMIAGIDIALVLDRIRPNADWGTATTYADLQRTWRDATTIPTEAEIEAEWQAILAERDAAAARKVWPNSAEFLAEFMPGNDLSKLAAIQNSSNQKIAALRLLLSVWVGEIWSDDPRILMGVAELVKIGILTEQEKTDILTP